MSRSLRKAVSTAALLSLGYLCLIAPRKEREAARKPFRTSYAHRGLHGGGVPENSLLAFSRAVERGFGIELDLHLSADGKIMVFHDDNLSRMTGRDEKISALTAEELRTLRLGGTDERIPYFSEVLALVDGKVPLLIELKGTSATDMSLCVAVEKALRGYQGLWCVESFNPMQIFWWRRHRPDVVRGQLITNLVKKKDGTLSKDPKDYLLTAMLLNVCARPDFVASNKKMKNLSVELSEKLFAADRFVWTVKGEEARLEALEEEKYPIFELEIEDLTGEENA